MIYIFLLMSISTILSYLILKFVYRIIFKSKKKISKFLVFLGSIILIIFYYTPYSFYLEPSFYKFRNICKLDPEIYQANGGKINEEYYNKALKYFDTSLDTMDWNNKNSLRTNDRGILVYRLQKYFEDGRINFSIGFYFKDKNAKKSSIDKVGFYATWDNYRIFPAGNEGTGFYLSGDWEDCDYFKKGLNNAK